MLPHWSSIYTTFTRKNNGEAILMFWKISDPKLFCNLRIDDKLLASQLSKSDFFCRTIFKKKKKRKRTPLCKVQSAATFCRSHLATLKVNGDWKHFMIPHKREKNTVNFFVRYRGSTREASLFFLTTLGSQWLEELWK